MATSNTTISQPTDKTFRSPQLDFLRGIAVLLVLFRHPVLPSEKAGALQPVASFLHNFGWTGVDLFFVLSGFLVGGLLFKEFKTHSSIDVRRFWLRRGLKIWPSYYVLLIFGSLQIIRESQKHAVPIKEALTPVLYNLIHLQNYLGSPFGITWTLAVEEHFYLALPLVLVLVLRFVKKPLGESLAIPGIAVGLVLVCNAIRYFVNTGIPFEARTHVDYTHIRIDSLFWGVFLSWIYHFHPDRLSSLSRYPWRWGLFGAVLLLPMMFIPVEAPFVWTIGYTLLYLGYGCICLVLASLPNRNIAPARMKFFDSGFAKFVCFVGLYSYSIYLWHANISLYIFSYRFIVPPFSNVNPTVLWPIAMTVYIASAVLVGFIMSKLIEIPVLKWRERFVPANATALPDKLVVSASSAALTQDFGGKSTVIFQDDAESTHNPPQSSTAS